LVWAADQFNLAVQEAKKAKLTEVHTVGEGIPFYTEKTLDPIWEERSDSAIVRVPALLFTDQNGKLQSEKLFEGKVTLITFFFTSCAGFCPTLLENLRRVEAHVKGKFPNVRFVAISVDPETDTPEKLKRYFKKMKFSPSWTLLTGNKTRIYALARETFAAEVFQLPKSKGQVAHSEHFYVIDQKRRLRGVLKGTRIDVHQSALQLLTALPNH